MTSNDLRASDHKPDRLCDPLETAMVRQPGMMTRLCNPCQRKTPQAKEKRQQQLKLGLVSNISIHISCFGVQVVVLLASRKHGHLNRPSPQNTPANKARNTNYQLPSNSRPSPAQPDLAMHMVDLQDAQWKGPFLPQILCTIDLRCGG